MPEWRKDPILERWVVIATERGKRPSDFKVPREDKKGHECPLCEHHEAETPPEVLAYREKESESNRPGWWVRVVSNKFPALQIEGHSDVRKQGIYQLMDGVGAHEVVIETPDHKKPLESLNEYQVREVIRAWRDRSLDLRRDTRFRYIQVFKNYGNAAGASLEHPHSQIIATPMVPTYIMEKMGGLTKYARETGSCILCGIIQQELQDPKRVVIESQNFVSLTPFASRFPFETWILPREHQADYGHIREDQVGDLAFVLRSTLKKIAVALGQPPYNMVLVTAPVNFVSGELVHFHWHIEIMPRLTTAAGFELGTGFYINPTPPEMAAAELRETVLVYDEAFNNNIEVVEKYV